MNSHKFPYKWNLKDGYPAKGVKYHGKKVFGTFICGGGSSMGYKLAGYEHLGGVEIDPKVAGIYKENHNPKYLYVEDIRAFNQRSDLPKELYSLDLLDGSPPCSSFSMAGNRDKDWGKKKQFREGQEIQRLDDLVFEYIRTIKKLQPKVAILENVKGLITGNAKAYARRMKIEFEAAGYRVQVFLLNAASMGVPQKRERVFFIGMRSGFDVLGLNLDFNEEPVTYSQYCNDNDTNENLTEMQIFWYNKCKKGQAVSEVHPKGHWFGFVRMAKNMVAPTIVAGTGNAALTHPSIKRSFNKSEYCQAGSYPLDFDFKDIKPKYLIGMSVPPVMAAQISHQIFLQWLSKV